MDQERYDKGMANLKTVMGDGAQMVTGMQDMAPDLTRYVVELFGDALADPVLDLKTREIATVAALTALGYASKKLHAHIGGALNVGATRQEIVAVITQMYGYAGFPAAINGIGVAREAFAERDAKGLS